MIDPKRLCFFNPDNWRLHNSQKAQLFERVGGKMGRHIKKDFNALTKLPDDIIPVVGCTPELRPIIDDWIARKREFIYWDRGYFRRNNYATDLPIGANGGYYRWHINSYQMQKIRSVPPDRWQTQSAYLWQWSKKGKHIVVAEPAATYALFHKLEDWTERTIAALKAVTDRPLVRRTKDDQRFRRKLHEDLMGAHCLVTHGSNAAVEAVIMGCPVFVHPDSAAALVGLTDLARIEKPIYPDRDPWMRALAYSQFNESEFFDGTLWRLLT